MSSQENKGPLVHAVELATGTHFSHLPEKFRAAQLADMGYRKISAKHHIIARIDRPDWVDYMATQQNRAPSHFYRDGSSLPDAGAADHFRRVYAQDTIEGVNPEVFKLIPASHGSYTGYVPLDPEGSPSARMLHDALIELNSLKEDHERLQRQLKTANETNSTLLTTNTDALLALNKLKEEHERLKARAETPLRQEETISIKDDGAAAVSSADSVYAGVDLAAKSDETVLFLVVPFPKNQEAALDELRSVPHADLALQVVTLQEALHAQQRTVSEVETVINERMARNGELTDKVSELQQQIGTMQVELNAYKAGSHAWCDFRIKKYQTHAEELTKERDDYANRVRALAIGMSQLRNEAAANSLLIRDQKAEIQAIKETLATTDGDSNARLLSIRRLSDELKGARELAYYRLGLVKLANAERDAAVKKRDQLQELVNRRSDALDMAVGERDRARKQRDTLSQSKALCETNLNEALQRANRFHQQLDIAEKERDEARGRRDEAEMCMTKLNDKNKKLEHELNNVKAARDLLQGELAHKETEGARAHTIERSSTAVVGIDQVALIIGWCGRINALLNSKHWEDPEASSMMMAKIGARTKDISDEAESMLKALQERAKPPGDRPQRARFLVERALHWAEAIETHQDLQQCKTLAQWIIDYLHDAHRRLQLPVPNNPHYFQ